MTVSTRSAALDALLSDYAAWEDDTLTDLIGAALSKATRREARSHRNDRWHGDDSEVHAFLAANPAF